MEYLIVDRPQLPSTTLIANLRRGKGVAVHRFKIDPEDLKGVRSCGFRLFAATAGGGFSTYDSYEWGARISLGRGGREGFVCGPPGTRLFTGWT